MQNTIRTIAVALAVLSVSGAAFAVKTPKCPQCKMTLSAKRDKDHPIEVKVGKKAFYCARCAAHKPKFAKPASGPIPR